MNERNVAALRAILHQLASENAGWLITSEMAEKLAPVLASHGVLVPSALTKEQADQWNDGCGCCCSETYLGPWLEQIAKGEVKI